MAAGGPGQPAALRAAIPLLGAAQAAAKGLCVSDGKLATLKATLREDSQGALALASSPAGRGTPRPKLYVAESISRTSTLQKPKTTIDYL